MMISIMRLSIRTITFCLMVIFSFHILAPESWHFVDSVKLNEHNRSFYIWLLFDIGMHIASHFYQVLTIVWGILLRDLCWKLWKSRNRYY